MGPPRNNSSLAVRAGPELATSGFQVRRPNRSATLPPADNEEIRLRLFADDLSGVLKDNFSLVTEFVGPEDQPR